MSKPGPFTQWLIDYRTIKRRHPDGQAQDAYPGYNSYDEDLNVQLEDLADMMTYTRCALLDAQEPPGTEGIEALHLILETAELDSRSPAFDPPLREEIGRAVALITDKLPELEEILR